MVRTGIHLHLLSIVAIAAWGFYTRWQDSDCLGKNCST